MKPFKSFLCSQLEEYILYRQGLGYKDRNLRLYLLYFDRSLKDKEADWDTALFFLEFRRNLKLNSQTVNHILSAVRGFFNYLIRLGSLEKNPLLDIPSSKVPRFIPFVFSEQQVQQFLRAIQKRIRKDEKHFLNDLAQYIAILLLARCGLRISEPIGLLFSNYRPEDGTIYIEKTKFKKDRLIPIPGTVRIEIQNYLWVRKSLLGQIQSPYLLVRKNRKRLFPRNLYPVFRQAVKDIGLDQPKQTIANTTFARPTPHSLRHSFAVNTLKRIKTQGKSPQNALPILAAYMGHRKYCYTAVYLKLTDAQQRQGLINFAKKEDI
jgi:integrase